MKLHMKLHPSQQSYFLSILAKLCVACFRYPHLFSSLATRSLVNFSSVITAKEINSLLLNFLLLRLKSGCKTSFLPVYQVVNKILYPLSNIFVNGISSFFTRSFELNYFCFTRILSFWLSSLVYCELVHGLIHKWSALIHALNCKQAPPLTKFSA